MGIQKTEILDFAKYFKDFSDSYSIIGGTATLLYLDERNPGQHNKATRDLDIVVLDLSNDQKQSRFLDRFKTYVETMQYEAFEGGDGKIKAYRFTDSKNALAPRQIEIATRRLGGIPLTQKTQRLDAFDMSAIVCEPHYIEFVRANSELKPVLGETSELIPLAKVVSIIMMKALAYINLEESSAQHAARHASDIIRLSAILLEGDQVSVPDKIYEPYLNFKNRVGTAFNPTRIKELLGSGFTADGILADIDRFVVHEKK